MKKRRGKPTFKTYDPDQMMLIPPSLDELISPTHPVRVVNQVIENVDIDPVIKKYKGGGTSSYHPKMLLKVLVFGYLSNIYSSRKLEAAVKENIHFMWLAGMSRPDHHTINRFRSERLKGVLKEVFSQVVLLLAESGHVDLKDVYTDGTKIEANANKYTFVWGKAIKTSKERIKKQLEGLWAYTQQVAKEELKEKTADFTNIEADKVRHTVEQINEALKSKKKVNKKVKQKVNYARKHWPGKLKEYEEKEKILGARNSYSKTDHDATFMRMKDDHMQNGQLKAAYNLQLSTQKQFILHYSIHQKPADTTTFIPHFNQFKKLYCKLPENITADAGYGSEENYHYVANQKGIKKGFIKYNYFHKEQRKKKNPAQEKITDNLHYNKEKDCYYCPMGQPMHNKGTKERVTSNGYKQTQTIYQAKNCYNCPIAGSCHKSKGNKTIAVNHLLKKYKQRAAGLLLSEEGVKKRKNRPADVEAVFGQLKQNKNFKRFSLRGLNKVEIEMGLMAIAHNLAKAAA